MYYYRKREQNNRNRLPYKMKNEKNGSVKMENEIKTENLRIPQQGVSIVVVEPPKPEPKTIGSGNKKVRCRKCNHTLFWLDDWGASCDACKAWIDLESAMGAI
tara:strand:- start:471 stop:779 length:309 start_codon:yes stop_codon:yes gene_type:complete